MQRRVLYILCALLLLIGVSVALYMVITERHVTPTGTGSVPAHDLRGKAIFTDGEHGFSLEYPDSDQSEYTFASYYHLPATWRAGALTDATGTPIISIVGYRIDQPASYPRYFDAEVRIGASKDPKELAACLSAATDQGEVALPDVTLGGTTFKAFSFSSAGMMQYLKGISYRAIHNGSCIAIEQLETGSNYRDDPKSSKDIPDSVLDAKYAALDAVVKTFTFVTP